MRNNNSYKESMKLKFGVFFFLFVSLITYGSGFSFLSDSVNNADANVEDTIADDSQVGGEAGSVSSNTKTGLGILGGTVGGALLTTIASKSVSNNFFMSSNSRKKLENFENLKQKSEDKSLTLVNYNVLNALDPILASSEKLEKLKEKLEYKEGRVTSEKVKKFFEDSLSCTLGEGGNSITVNLKDDECGFMFSTTLEAYEFKSEFTEANIKSIFLSKLEDKLAENIGLKIASKETPEQPPVQGNSTDNTELNTLKSKVKDCYQAVIKNGGNNKKEEAMLTDIKDENTKKSNEISELRSKVNTQSSSIAQMAFMCQQQFLANMTGWDLKDVRNESDLDIEVKKSNNAEYSISFQDKKIIFLVGTEDLAKEVKEDNATLDEGEKIEKVKGLLGNGKCDKILKDYAELQNQEQTEGDNKIETTLPIFKSIIKFYEAGNTNTGKLNIKSAKDKSNKSLTDQGLGDLKNKIFESAKGIELSSHVEYTQDTSMNANSFSFDLEEKTNNKWEITKVYGKEDGANIELSKLKEIINLYFAQTIKSEELLKLAKDNNQQVPTTGNLSKHSKEVFDYFTGGLLNNDSRIKMWEEIGKLKEEQINSGIIQDLILALEVARNDVLEEKNDSFDKIDDDQNSLITVQSEFFKETGMTLAIAQDYKKVILISENVFTDVLKEDGKKDKLIASLTEIIEELKDYQSSFDEMAKEALKAMIKKNLKDVSVNQDIKKWSFTLNVNVIKEVSENQFVQGNENKFEQVDDNGKEVQKIIFNKSLFPKIAALNENKLLDTSKEEGKFVLENWISTIKKQLKTSEILTQKISKSILENKKVLENILKFGKNARKIDVVWNDTDTDEGEEVVKNLFKVKVEDNTLKIYSNFLKDNEILRNGIEKNIRKAAEFSINLLSYGSKVDIFEGAYGQKYGNDTANNKALYNSFLDVLRANEVSFKISKSAADTETLKTVAQTAKKVIVHLANDLSMTIDKEAVTKDGIVALKGNDEIANALYKSAIKGLKALDVNLVLEKIVGIKDSAKIIANDIFVKSGGTQTLIDKIAADENFMKSADSKIMTEIDLSKDDWSEYGIANQALDLKLKKSERLNLQKLFGTKWNSIDIEYEKLLSAGTNKPLQEEVKKELYEIMKEEIGKFIENQAMNVLQAFVEATKGDDLKDDFIKAGDVMAVIAEAAAGQGKSTYDKGVLSLTVKANDLNDFPTNVFEPIDDTAQKNNDKIIIDQLNKLITMINYVAKNKDQKKQAAVEIFKKLAEKYDMDYDRDIREKTGEELAKAFTTLLGNIIIKNAKNGTIPNFATTNN